MHPFRNIIIVTALLLAAAACGDDSTAERGDDLPVNTGSAGDDITTEPACLPDEPDCDDTVAVSDEGQDLESDDNVGSSSGMTVDGGLTIEEARTRGPADGIIAVRGIFYRDDSGTFLCGLIAESLPPQCGGAVLELKGPVDETISAPIQEAQGVQWTDEAVTVFGIVDNEVLTVDATVTG